MRTCTGTSTHLLQSRLISVSLTKHEYAPAAEPVELGVVDEAHEGIEHAPEAGAIQTTAVMLVELVEGAAQVL